MPNYRLRLQIGAMRPGIAPQQIIPAVADALTELAVVEAHDVEITGRQAWAQWRIHLPDTGDAEEDARAWEALGIAAATVETMAAVGGRLLLRRYPGGRWSPLVAR